MSISFNLIRSVKIETGYLNRFYITSKSLESKVLENLKCRIQSEPHSLNSLNSLKAFALYVESCEEFIHLIGKMPFRELSIMMVNCKSQVNKTRSHAKTFESSNWNHNGELANTSNGKRESLNGFYRWSERGPFNLKVSKRLFFGMWRFPTWKFQCIERSLFKWCLRSPYLILKKRCLLRQKALKIFLNSDRLPGST